MATYDFKQFVLRVVRKAALSLQVRLHAGERHMTLLEWSCSDTLGSLGLLLRLVSFRVLYHDC